MRNVLIAGVLAASVAIAGLAPAPARAASDGDKALLLILGAAAVYGIAKDAERKRKKRAAAEAAASNRWVYPQSDWHYDRRRHSSSWKHRKGGAMPVPRERRTRLLPLRCVREFDGAHQSRRAVSSRCLTRAGYRAPLPAECSVRLRSRGTVIDGYGLRCLASRGYVFGDTRR